MTKKGGIMHLLKNYFTILLATAALVACADEDSATTTGELTADGGIRMMDPVTSTAMVRRQRLQP